MTTTYQRLEADIAEARKARDSMRLTVLTLLQSKIQRIAKDDGNREIREDGADSPLPEKDRRNDVVLGVSRYKKEVDDMRWSRPAARPTSRTTSSASSTATCPLSSPTSNSTPRSRRRSKAPIERARRWAWS